MAKMNGTWKVIVAVLGTLLTALATASGVIYGYASLNKDVETNCREIKVMQPEVKLNSQHRYQDEIDTTYIKERMNKMEATQQRIEQRQQEQTAVLNEIYREVKK